MKKLAIELSDIFPEPNEDQILEFANIANVDPDYLKNALDKWRCKKSNKKLPRLKTLDN